MKNDVLKKCIKKKEHPGKGVTLTELLVVVVIVAIGSSMFLPKIDKGIENQKALNALNTLRTISQARRMYVMEVSGLLTTNVLPSGNPMCVAGTSAIDELVNKGYLDRNDFAPGFTYTFGNTSAFFVSNRDVIARTPEGRQISFESQTWCAGNPGGIGGDSYIKDSDGYIGPTTGLGSDQDY
ncbi:MAG: hypothetical protein A3G33_03430 [Omnitrophica bacterium RIFCSPLOWO2_12_FULL_44_17]|uniref:Type II secretion system protein GspG C-terminal domain-containing protein n=1 Tax=Candidatus Danuiimicrobium aquiferis TaxID=1801832 RepID=A0A1G1KUX6_9BACT|nr:MAG: hypothetical protein A3B72_06975 [Omnitrophica bacterium RIFCSPHIGHO2_02_FULL_45_28]OGW96369.1 MAG: hypothetical protein A3G33_03430 [Omnitrophica bacterium RIFCSPLOWO2_12_FULL_44_17]OGX04822.1 MAG: hypothetical protein A3J12_07700 [Omnitrophica bacterium RIFCSPLOWO2_02_FULL_44_11]